MRERLGFVQLKQTLFIVGSVLNKKNISLFIASHVGDVVSKASRTQKRGTDVK